ncbi:Os04g0644050 [Oryza sativa Japonica Group]|uniref:Os04g0644050 protein n=1 Tax=Oryza sativa subsp. japonica TaxID=39947 RepID=A0A0P0WFP3_ORYSJ|nr:Os04g0644050 [Oryza sativa Japonica Group]
MLTMTLFTSATSCTVTSSLRYMDSFAVATSTQGRMSSSAVCACGCVTQSSMATHVSATTLPAQFCQCQCLNTLRMHFFIGKIQAYLCRRRKAADIMIVMTRTNQPAITSLHTCEMGVSIIRTSCPSHA